MCGRWVSLCGSPEVRIVFTGTRCRLDFSYDAEKETLLLSDYGEYIRADEE
jgi:hypothetical protein